MFKWRLLTQYFPVLFQNQQAKNQMGAALFTTGPYIEMTIAAQTPMTPSIEGYVYFLHLYLSARFLLVVNTYIKIAQVDY